MAFDIAGGEQSVLAQYLGAIDAARRSIYIENQAIPIPQVSARLEQALSRGVEIVALVPADPEKGSARRAGIHSASRCLMASPRSADMRVLRWPGLQARHAGSPQQHLRP